MMRSITSFAALAAFFIVGFAPFTSNTASANIMVEAFLTNENYEQDFNLIVEERQNGGASSGVNFVTEASLSDLEDPNYIGFLITITRNPGEGNHLSLNGMGGVRWSIESDDSSSLFDESGNLNDADYDSPLVYAEVGGQVLTGSGSQQFDELMMLFAISATGTASLGDELPINISLLIEALDMGDPAKRHQATFTINAVPEPGTLVLAAAGSLLVLGRRR